MRTAIHREVAINAGSMADIAFLLLIFFLITTTMTTDMGILRKLPEYNPSPETSNIRRHTRNVMVVLINRNNQLMVQGKALKPEELKSRVKEFVDNPQNREDLPEKTLTNIKGIGNIWASSKHVISLQNDQGTSYKYYITVQNEITSAYNELRNELAWRIWKSSYKDMDKDRKDEIDSAYPMCISEAEPVEIYE